MKLYDVIQKEYPKKLHTDDAPREPYVHTPQKHPHHTKRRILFFGIVALLAVAIYAVGVGLVRAKVIVEERVVPFTLDHFTLNLPHETEADTTRLSFQTMKVTTEITREIFGSELKEVSGKARGSAIFFNEYSTASQTIKMGTKLTGANGKTYTTQASVTVPGYKTVDKKKVPGTSPSVPIIAANTGADSNTTGTTFSISGTSGAKKQQLYARSAGVLSGGESGIMHTVSDAERPQVVETLKTQLTERLKRETRAQIPPELTTFPDLQFVSIDTNSLTLSGAGVRFTAKLKGSMTTYLIPKTLLEQAIATETFKDTTYPLVSIPELQTLSVTPMSAIPVNGDTPPESISIALSGEGNIITEVVPEHIASLLVGAKRSSFNDTMGSIPEIQSAKYHLYPFWAPFFPKSLSHITVETR